MQIILAREVGARTEGGGEYNFRFWRGDTFFIIPDLEVGQYWLGIQIHVFVMLFQNFRTIIFNGGTNSKIMEIPLNRAQPFH